MEATTIFPSTFNLPSNKSACHDGRRRFPAGSRGIVIARASGGGGGSGGRDGGGGGGGGGIVDESMIVLRMRIKEMKKYEEEEDDVAGGDWMEWEKEYYYGGGYGEDVCGAIGLLQSYLMSLRPSFALGIVAFVGMSVSISCGLTLFHSLQFLNTLFSIFN